MYKVSQHCTPCKILQKWFENVRSSFFAWSLSNFLPIMSKRFNLFRSYKYFEETLKKYKKIEIPEKKLYPPFGRGP